MVITVSILIHQCISKQEPCGSCITLLYLFKQILSVNLVFAQPVQKWHASSLFTLPLKNSLHNNTQKEECVVRRRKVFTSMLHAVEFWGSLFSPLIISQVKKRIHTDVFCLVSLRQLWDSCLQAVMWSCMQDNCLWSWHGTAIKLY